MKYSLQVVVETIEGPPDLLHGESTVSIDLAVIQTGTGGIESYVLSSGITREGITVNPGWDYYVKGFDHVFFYTGRGFNEGQWAAQYLYYQEIAVTGDVINIPNDCARIRLQVQTDEALPNGTDRWYMVVGSLPTEVFGSSSIWSHLDLGDDKPAMTYQANDIAELKDRQADYSQALKLPLTAHNLTVLGLPDHVDSQTNFPYTTVECRLYADEYELAGKGAVLVIDAVTDAIECQVLGSSASLFDLLEESPMSDLTEPSFTRDYGGDLVPAAGADLWPNGFEFVAASFTKGAFHHLLEMNPVYMLPVVNDLYLLGKILEAHGYKWVHNLAGYAGTDKNALPVVTLDPDADSLLMFDSAASRANAVAPLANGGINYNKLTVSASGIGTLVAFGTGLTSTEAGVALTPAFPTKLKIRFQTSVATCPYAVSVRAVIIKAGDTDDVFDSGWVDPETTAIDSTELEIEVDKDSVINVLLSARSNEVTVAPKVITGLNATFTANQYSADAVPLYGIVHVPRNLGFDTQFDYFKAFVQRYGLTVMVDHATSTVYTYTMKQVYDNKAFARDWSDKLVERGGEMSFRADGYARSNDIAFKDNDEDNVTDKGTFTVADATLDKEKTLFDLPFEAGLDWGVSDKFASVPVFDVPDLSDEITTDAQRLGASEYSGGKPHLLRVSSDTVNLFVTGFGDDRDYHRATHVTAQSLIDTYYAELTDSMLVKAKRRIDTFYLTPADIEAFDPFVPVYIRQYGAYFYVNKISNFIVGRLTSVELIKL